jgi:DNA helicase-2/ATP-dependent DNA helicase PcrA
MRLIADLHVHSRFSRAVSKDMTLPNMHQWASWKGIGLVGTGDFTHPTWFAEMRDQLVPTPDGFFELKAALRQPHLGTNPLFILSTELSCIYTEHEQTRRIHLVVLAPSLQTVEKINTNLGRDFNIKSDGRPILGISAHDLTARLLTIDPSILIIPAHVWTPWFSLFGSKSGYDSANACFRELFKHIPAIETGLSSDPTMNWQWSHLDQFTIVSAGDAHSPRKFGREATVFDLEKPGYAALAAALWNNPVTGKNPSPNRILETLEFFPEEGKYHLDGHAACKQRLTPAQTKRAKGICPVCKKPLTVGVLNRVKQLADRTEGYTDAKRPPFRSLVPLEETIGEALNVGPASKKVQALYLNLVQKLGGEFNVLLETPLPDITRVAGETVAEAIQRVRTGKVHVEGGYDGIFGTVKIFSVADRQRHEQAALF